MHSKEKEKEKEKENIKGNTFIYFIFQVCNIALAILGLCTMGISAYLIGATKSLNTFSLSFMAFGASLIILSYFGCNLRYSPFGNLLYMLILSIIFLCDLFATILIFFFKENIIEWVLINYDQNEMSIAEYTKLVNQNITTVNYFLLIIVLIFVKTYMINKFNKLLFYFYFYFYFILILILIMSINAFYFFSFLLLFFLGYIKDL
jgi:hypothetical protein